MLAESMWFLTLACLVVLVFVFAFVISNASEHEEYTEVQAKWYAFRSKWIVFLFGFGVVVTLVTLIPYPISNQDGVADAKVVNVIGHQWYWEIDNTEYAVGDTIEFHVTSGDANHGFGIYDSHDHILTQTQAMPGYVNKIVYTFNEPGTYKVLCMEYCGLAHHSMLSELKVK